jgi:hypothetical protein
VQISADLQILAYIVDWIIGIELLGKPDAKLPGHQFPAFTLRSRHACIPLSFCSYDFSGNRGIDASSFP